MPNFDMAKQPRYPLIKVDTDEPLTEEQLLTLLSKSNGITLCVRSRNGHINRGGHFFCIQRLENEKNLLESMEQEYIDTFPTPVLVRFINHACGLKFDRDMQLYCQNSLNFRMD